MTDRPRKILVIVHPGSCCGSADMNLGRYEAGALRDYLADTVNAWRGPVLVIDGNLSDELAQTAYESLGRAIKNALRRAKYAKLPAKREWGCDDCGPGSSGATVALIKNGVMHLATTLSSRAPDQRPRFFRLPPSTHPPYDEQADIARPDADANAAGNPERDSNDHHDPPLLGGS